MTELLKNTLVLCRFLAFAIYLLGIPAFIVVVRVALDLEGWYKLMALPAIALGVIWTAAVPMMTRWVETK